MHKSVMFSEFMDYLNHLMEMVIRFLERLAEHHRHHHRDNHHHRGNHQRREGNHHHRVVMMGVVVAMMMMAEATALTALIYGKILATMQNRHH